MMQRGRQGRVEDRVQIIDCQGGGSSVSSARFKRPQEKSMSSHRIAHRARIAVGVSLLAAAAGTPSWAEDPPKPPPEGVWVGDAQAGFLATTGNSSADALNARWEMARVDGPWKNNLYLGGLYSKSNGITSAERVEGRYELDRQISGDLFGFGALGGIWDQFSGFNYQVNLTGGVGYTFINNASTKLSTTAGIGVQFLQTQELIKNPNGNGQVIDRINGPQQAEFIGTLGVSLEQKLTDSTKIVDKLQLAGGGLNTGIANDFSLLIAMNAALAVNLGWSIRYNTNPAPGATGDNQSVFVNLVYNFK
jgi:putative salt-induced outer membrane protein